MDHREPHITVQDLTMAYGDFVLMRDLDFIVNRGDIFIIMGGEWVWKKYTSKGHGRSEIPCPGEGPLPGNQLLGYFPSRAEPDHEKYGHPLPERRFVELHDLG